jgi:dolichol kinase
VFGHAKSVAGTLAFFVVSLAILLAVGHWSNMPLGLHYALAISVLASILENLAVFGSDNLLVPLLVALMLVNH